MGATEGTAGIQELARSRKPAHRAAAARLLRLVGGQGAGPILRTLIEDEDLAVSRLAMFAAGQMSDPDLIPLLIQRVNRPGVLGAARAALALSGDAALPHVMRAFDDAGDSAARRGLVSALSRIKSPEAIRFLVSRLEVEDVAVRQDVVRALAHHRFVASSGKDREHIEDLARSEARRALETLAQVRDLDAVEGTATLRRALIGSHRNTRERLLMLLGFARDPKAFLAVRTHIDGTHKDRRAYAREILDVVLSREERALFLPAIEGVIEDLGAEQAEAMGLVRVGAADRVRELFLDDSPRLEAWIRAAALEAAPHLASPELDAAIETFLSTSIGANFLNTGKLSLDAIRGVLRAKEIGPMLLIEKVITLKAVEMFARTAEDVLADVAVLAEEVRFKAGETIFAKGDAGESLFVIVSGEVKIHDGDLDLKRLKSRSVFGELAVLDPEPRSASVTAVSDTHLLRLDREAFLELMAGNLEVVRGVLSVLCDRIREKLVEATPVREPAART
jgi:HEAT repeat protein